MLANSTQLGATTQGTTFADIIINNVNGVADGMIQGFAQFVHDPKTLKETVSIFAKAAAPRKFADAVVLRRIETQKLDDIWNFPLNMAVPTTCPIPWCIVEAAVKSQTTPTSWEFNLMRTIDFIGRNYIRIVLPAVDTSQVVDSTMSGKGNMLNDPEHFYLGAWHRDLIPLLIQQVEFYPRSNVHKLFEYSGYDIYVHNILFGNANKEMNDLMSGEDKFELCYDPYRVDGSAMGMSSYKGIDTYKEVGLTEAAVNGAGANVSTVTWGDNNKATQLDNIANYLQLDTTMDDYEFRTVYRHNVWYEAPVAKNYHARHSIHSRRVFHQAKDIVIPLDILPFGYSIASSLPAAALSGECGFVKITLWSDWLDRAFYLTKVSDIPALHPLVQHTHYSFANPAEGSAEKHLNGWVNPRSVGRFGDITFTSGTDAEGDVDSDGVYKYPFSQPGNVIGLPGQETRENIIPVTYGKEGPESLDTAVQFGKKGRLQNFKTFITPGSTGEGASKVTNSTAVQRGDFANVVRTSTTRGVNVTYANSDLIASTQFLHKLSNIDPTYYKEVKDEVSLKLLQVGYQTLPCIREFLAKLPNIYITTEWDDKDRYLNSTTFDINNDLYLQAVIIWAIAVEGDGRECMRVYPCHMVDHELPILAGLKLFNEQSQGTTIYDWSMLNVLNPAQMNLHPLIENMGLISFSPTLSPNTLPHAYYDSNISGYLRCELLNGEGNTNIDTPVNLKSGYLKVISIGINGVASVNLNLFRLIF